ncbi:MAG: TIGR02186 family protein [Hyphomonadaceae bacterium]|nr:TIGR02186 family protein [Hyphomonadaceae bacterium]
MLAGLALVCTGLVVLGIGETAAQQQPRRKAPPPVAKEAPRSGETTVKREQQPGARESVEADVSARTVAVTSSFNGTEIVIFGAIDGSQQPSAESGYYDVIVVVEGVPSRLVVRRKGNVAGLWLNTASATFDNVPSYYAVASTRPIDEIAPEDFRALHGIGLKHLKYTPAVGQRHPLSSEDIKEYRDAIMRLKRRDGLYLDRPYGVIFTGKSIFRASIVLPANVTVGPFDTRVLLFRDEKLLSRFSVRLTLEREGLERYLHAFAYRLPVLYGIVTVMIAVGAGLLASTIFRKASH